MLNEDQPEDLAKNTLNTSLLLRPGLPAFIDHKVQFTTQGEGGFSPGLETTCCFWTNCANAHVYISLEKEGT